MRVSSLNRPSVISIADQRAVFNAFFLPLIFFFYPETQRLSLEQIDKLFTGDKVIMHWEQSMTDFEAAGLPGDSNEEKVGNVDRVEAKTE